MPDGEQMCSSTLSLTSALDEVGSQRHAPTALSPGKIRYPLYKKLGGPQGRSGQVRKISPPPRFDPRTVQPVDSRYTVYAIPDHILNITNVNKIPRTMTMNWVNGWGKSEQNLGITLNGKMLDVK